MPGWCLERAAVPGRLDVNHVGAEVAEQAAGERARPDAGQVKHPDAAQRAVGELFRLRSRLMRGLRHEMPRSPRRRGDGWGAESPPRR